MSALLSLRGVNKSFGAVHVLHGSTLAIVAGVLLASRDNSVSPTTGGAQTLLYAVGAAVIGGTRGDGALIDALGEHVR